MSHGSCSAPYGNYRGYYARRRAHHALPVDRDERLALLDEEWFRGATVLDIGCNVGAVSVEIAQRMRPAKVIGVDIDPYLVGQCRHTVERAFSQERPRLLQVPSAEDGQEATSELGKRKSDGDGAAPSAKRRRKRQGDRKPPKLVPTVDTSPSHRPDEETHHFPAYFADLLGPIDPRGHRVFDPTVLSEHERAGHLFPRNVAFFTADWVTDQLESDEGGYDVILALSLTKWIHLNHLDTGLIAFFRKCHRHLKSGGRFVLEKQGWKGYKDAKRGSEILTKNYFQLKLRPEVDFERILLEQVGFSRKEVVRESERGKGFDRDIEVYFKA